MYMCMYMYMYMYTREKRVINEWKQDRREERLEDQINREKSQQKRSREEIIVYLSHRVVIINIS